MDYQCMLKHCDNLCRLNKIPVSKIMNMKKKYSSEPIEYIKNILNLINEYQDIVFNDYFKKKYNDKFYNDEIFIKD